MGEPSLTDLVEGLIHLTTPCRAETEQAQDTIFDHAREGRAKLVLSAIGGGRDNVNARDMLRSGRTVLQEASARGHASLVRSLIRESGADVDVRTYLGGDTALHLAASFGHRDITFALLDSGADPDARNGFGASPLHCAATASVAGVLVRYGADATMRDGAGRTPARAALEGVRDGADGLVRYLAEAEKDRARDDVKGEIAAHRARREEAAAREAEERRREEEGRAEAACRRVKTEYVRWRSCGSRSEE